MRHTFRSMGTVISLETTASDETVAGVEGVFGDYDRRFSLYRPESELSRIATGTIRLTDASPALLEVYGEALRWRERTGGAFTPHRPDGVIDLNGIVKALALRDAGVLLRSATAAPWSLNVGGDILCEPGEPARNWTVGIVDPADRTAMLGVATLAGTRRAVATSGSAERGEHIWRGGNRRPPDYVQVTVLADDIVLADVLATAIVSGGRSTLDDATDSWPIDALTVSGDGALTATPGFRAALGLVPAGIRTDPG